MSRPPYFEPPRFDYKSFEKKLYTPSSGTIPSPIPYFDDRTIIRTPLTKRASATDVTFELAERGAVSVVTLRGAIDERFPSQTISSLLRGRVLLNLQHITLITSFGLRAWLDMLRDAAMNDVLIVAASPSVVREMSMVRSFAGGARLLSVVAVFRCSCGTEFGGLLEASTHRPWFDTPEKLVLPCPDCGQPAPIDDPPATYRGLRPLLATAVPEEVRWALAQDPDSPDQAPVVKTIEGNTTHLWFHGLVPRARAFVDALGGLQGDATLHLEAAVEPDRAWVDDVVPRWAVASLHATSITVEGAPLELAEALFTTRPPKTFVRSVRLPGSPQEPVDLRRPPAGPLAKRLKAIRGLSPPTAGARWRTRLLLVVGMLALVGTAAAGLLTAMQPLLDLAEPVPTWAHGSSVPPAWVTERPRQDGDTLTVGVVAHGPSTGDALAQARFAAWDQLRAHAVRDLEWAPEPGPGTTEVFYDNVVSSVRLVRGQMERQRTEDRVWVAVEYRVDPAQFDSMLADHRGASPLGPLVVRPSPPWLPPGWVVVESRAGPIDVGDRVLAIDGRRPSSLDEIRLAHTHWQGLPTDSPLEVTVLRDGVDVTLSLGPPEE